MEEVKRCSGCKTEKPVNEFYKNKLMDDGHSIYCIPCTKVNSKKYHQRKKVKQNQVGTERIMQQMIVNNLMSEFDHPNVDKLMKLILIEKSLKDLISQVHELKMENATSEQTV